MSSLYSPFRYPGGKTWLVPRIRQWLASIPKPKYFIEPFAGGAIVSLTVAFEGYADKVILVEKDEQVASVWHTIINDEGGAEWLAKKINDFTLIAETAQIVISDKPKNTRELAFQTILQNRINHGGILADGAGILKNGEKGKGIHSRWYPQTLKKRILKIARIKENICFIEGDGVETIREHSQNVNATFFIDPPYTASAKKAGARLYKYHQLDHNELFHEVSLIKGDFLLTYDNAKEVRKLARDFNLKYEMISMRSTHHTTLSELVISKNLDWLTK
jgi:DNA adenine methylase